MFSDHAERMIRSDSEAHYTRRCSRALRDRLGRIDKEVTGLHCTCAESVHFLESRLSRIEQKLDSLVATVAGSPLSANGPPSCTGAGGHGVDSSCAAVRVSKEEFSIHTPPRASPRSYEEEDIPSQIPDGDFLSELSCASPLPALQPGADTPEPAARSTV